MDEGQKLAVVVKALIQVLADRAGGEGLNYRRSVKVKKDILEKLQHDYQVSGISSQRVCYFLRRAGFETRLSGGLSVVDVTLPLLAHACVRTGIEDEMVVAEIAKANLAERLKREVK